MTWPRPWKRRCVSRTFAWSRSMAGGPGMWSMSRVKLLFFATLRDRAGTKTAELQVPEGITVGALKERIAQDYPGIQPLIKTALVAVNRDYAGDETVVPDGADVALFPPVSGG